MPKLDAPNLDALSSDAKSVGAAWFSMFSPSKGTLEFKMVAHRPTPRAQAALDELVKAGVISRAQGLDGVVTYKALMKCRPFARWFNIQHINKNPDIDFKLIEAIA